MNVVEYQNGRLAETLKSKFENFPGYHPNKLLNRVDRMKRFLNIFTDLVRIPSVTGMDMSKKFAYIESFYSQQSFLEVTTTVEKDNNGVMKVTIPGEGNLADQYVAVCGHIDTVEPGIGIDPQIREIEGDYYLTSNEKTILASDDQVPVALFMAVTEDLVKNKTKRPTIEIILSSDEEGLGIGMSKYDFDQLHAADILIFDLAKFSLPNLTDNRESFDVVLAACGYRSFDIEMPKLSSEETISFITSLASLLHPKLVGRRPTEISEEKETTNQKLQAPKTKITIDEIHIGVGRNTVPGNGILVGTFQIENDESYEQTKKYFVEKAKISNGNITFEQVTNQTIRYTIEFTGISGHPSMNTGTLSVFPLVSEFLQQENRQSYKQDNQPDQMTGVNIGLVTMLPSKNDTHSLLLQGEIRYFNREAGDQVVSDIAQLIAIYDGRMNSIEENVPYRHDYSNSAIQRLIKIFEHLNIGINFIKTRSISDANEINKRRNAIVTSERTQFPHSVNERNNITDIDLVGEIIHSWIIGLMLPEKLSTKR